MHFHPNYPNDNNKGQRQVWHAIKASFERDEGVAYYRYPIFEKGRRGRSEPDFLMIHRRYGVWILESKGCLVGNITAIEGHDWMMRDWHRESESPVSQVDAQAFEAKKLLERDPVLRALKVPLEFRVVLPFVTRDEWGLQGFHRHPSTDGVVWLEDDLPVPAFRKLVHDASARYMPTLSDEMWGRLLAAFRGTVSDATPQPIGADTPVGSPRRVIHAIESRLRVLDEKQDRIAQEVPEGPQRLRGLAGSGKTILLARRVAQMHAAHPDWDIAFVFWSRSLYQQIRGQVEKSFLRMTGEAPNWDKLHVWHAWGGRDQPGFYRELSAQWNRRFLSFSAAEKLVTGSESAYGAAMRTLEIESEGCAPMFDAIVVDEGQDLPAAFYRTAYRSLRDPKRLYWAYDEAQGVDSLLVPTAAEIFGREQDGRTRVDLSGNYPSGIPKAHNMNRCYRTPRQILTVAHAVNMGLLREGGPLQGVSSKDDWLALGYSVLEGDFTQASVRDGATVVVERTAAASGHPIDASEFAVPFDRSGILVTHATASEAEDVDVVVSGIHRDLEAGLRPEEIAVVCLHPACQLLDRIADRLEMLGISALSLTENNKDQFRRDGSVTLSGIRRAKGNEAYKVYAVNLHISNSVGSMSINEELVGRNQILVALTRTKLWCVAVGRDGPLMRELAAAGNQRGSLRFPAFNQASLKRSMTDQDFVQQGLAP